MNLLKLITAGSVDDGKSTLIGRLLYDTKSILVDQLQNLQKQSKNKTAGEIDLAILTDGLRAEREQGITIDVAYKYFNTEKRKFILIDAPGHVQYTRNMVTGASNAQLAIILIDARHGVVEQTKRHSLIASLLGIKHIVVAINKMDLVAFSQQRFNEIITDFSGIKNNFSNDTSIYFIPVSALQGDNVVHASLNMPWYNGATLLQILEQTEIQQHINAVDVRFPVQYVIRPQSSPDLHDYRGYAGKLVSGILKKGDAVVVLPAQIETHIKSIEINAEEINEAQSQQSIVVQLTDDVDVSRGDMIVKKTHQPLLTQEITATVCWLDNKPLELGAKYILQHHGKQVRCAVKEINYKLNIHTLEKETSVSSLHTNEIAEIQLKSAIPLAIDNYKKIASNGAFILIDETSYATVGACMVQPNL